MSRTSTRILIILSALYLLSFSIQIFFPVEEKPYKGQSQYRLNWNDYEIAFDFLEYGNDKKGIPIVLTPDPFHEPGMFELFIEQLSQEYRVLVPLFPSTDSDGNTVSHSPVSRADMTLMFLEENGIEEFHLAGQGFGNAVAIEMLNNIRDDRIKSYAMLAALGVQEFHFLGYHVLNQPIYSAFYPVSWLMEYGLPVAHWTRNFTIGLEGARYLKQMDQRHFRDVLSDIEIPVHILHSRENGQVPVQTAQEHFRFISQSSLHISEGDFKAIHDFSREWAESYLEFLNNTQNGSATAKADVTPERLEAAQEGFKFGDVPPVRGWGLFLVILLLSIVTLITEDLGCIGAGLLAAGNVIEIWLAFSVIYFGILMADVGIYWMGRNLGRPVIEKAPFKWLITRKDIDWTASLFNSHGFKIIIGSRFLPGTRFPTYFSAGVLKTKFTTFLLYFILSISIWTPIVLGSSILIGQQMLDYLQIYQEYALHIFIGLVLAIYLGFKFLLPLATRKGRREMAVQFIRMRQRFFNR